VTFISKFLQFFQLLVRKTCAAMLLLFFAQRGQYLPSLMGDLLAPQVMYD
jgi:hypothetical protein